MRNLFFALVLANLAFAAWALWFAGDPAAGIPRDAAARPIRLVSEVSPEERSDGAEGAVAAAPGRPGASGPRDTAPGLDSPPPISPPSLAAPEAEGGDADAGGAPERVAAAVPAGAERCVSVGPLAELAEAASASARLRAAGYSPSQRVAEGDIWVGYWVHLDAIPTRAEANEMLAKLHENGIEEAYLIPGEEDGDIISLGVFSEIARAGRLREQVRGIGYEPLVVDRTRRGMVYWIDVLLPEGRELDFAILQTPGRITRLEQRPCAAPPAA